MGNSGVDAIAAGGEFSLAIKKGKVYSWGWNAYGQLGIGTTESSHVPENVAEGAMENDGVSAIAAGGDFSLAIKDGKVYS